MNIRWAIRLSLWIGVIVSCAKTASVVIPNRIEMTSHHLALQNQLQKIFPEQCRFSARINVKFAGKEMDFLTYTALNGLNIRSRAMGEFGGTLFDFLYLEGEMNLLTYPVQFPEKIVKKGPAEDIYHLFYVSRKRTPVDACGDNCIMISFEDNVSYAYEFSPEKVLLKSFEYLKGKLLREIHYGEWKSIEGMENFPSHIAVTQYALDYSFDMRILKLHPGIHNTNAFKLPAYSK